MDVLAILLSDDHCVRGQFSSLPDPAWLARRMVALYRCWSSPSRLDLVAVTEGFLDRLDSLDDPIRRTCLEAASAVACWGGHAYHSARHHAEVATNAMVIAELQGRLRRTMPSRQRALLLASCLAHDIYYQPQTDTRPRFAAESISADALDAIAQRCGLVSDDRLTLRCLILATEPAFRAELAKMVDGSSENHHPPEPLSDLARQPALTRLAAVLSDADLLSSSGLTERWHDVQVARLESESDRRVSPVEDMLFFDHVVGDDFLSPGGRHFSPNLVRIKCGVAANIPGLEVGQRI